MEALPGRAKRKWASSSGPLIASPGGPKSPNAPVDGKDGGQHGEGDKEQSQCHAVGIRVLEGLNLVIDSDGDGARDARNVATDHQHHSEFAERMSKAEDQRGDQAGNRERQRNLAEDAPASGSESCGSVKEACVHGFKRCDQRLYGKRQAVEQRRQQKTGESESQGVAEPCKPQLAQKAVRTH